jgi:transcription antitermination factor NusA-like protein
MAELHGEKIDIVDYSDDPAEFVGHALSPAVVSSVEIVDLEARSARVVVPEFQLSLAIGREGQNARLAARLTGWRIDIHGDEAREQRASMSQIGTAQIGVDQVAGPTAAPDGGRAEDAAAGGTLDDDRPSG